MVHLLIQLGLGVDIVFLVKMLCGAEMAQNVVRYMNGL
jgi:hypothetical protein